MNKRGTSLLELSIIVMVIGILTITAYGYYKSEYDHVAIQTTKLKVTMVKQAFRQFYADNGKFPRNLPEMSPRYLKSKTLRNAWKEYITLEYDEVPTVVYKLHRGGNVEIVREPVLEPWTSDTVKAYTLEQMFNLKTTPSKIMFGKTSIAGYLVEEETDGTDLMGHTVYNPIFGDYAYNASLEIWLKSPNDTATTENDQGHEFEFMITGGDIVSVVCSDPAAELVIENSSFSASSSVELVSYQLDIRNCPYLASFNVTTFRPATPDTIFYYGDLEVLTIPEFPLYNANETGTTPVLMRQNNPMTVERYFHENTYQKK